MTEINPRIEAARKVYELFWDSYLSADMETFASVLDEQLELIGTSESEIAHSKPEGLTLLEAQLNEVVGNVEKRNRKVTSVFIGDLILINELCDIYFRNEQAWNFYSKLRLSTFLRETKEGWKVVQQHGSLPDQRVEGDQTIALEKISKENIELRDAVKRRTAELESKNRELEVEAALERVRARTMAMHRSDELAETSTLIFEQFQKLGILPQRCGFVVQKDDNESMEIWGAVKNDKGFTSYRLGMIQAKAHPIFTLGIAEWRKGSQGFSYTLSGESLKNYHKAIAVSVNLPGSVADRIIEASKVEYHYNAFFKQGSITTIFDQKPDEATQFVVQRFARVMEQTYTRFLDLKKAEAQAREAQIEAALERTRTQSMLMKHSDEIKSISNVFHEQLLRLGIPSEFSYVWLPDEVSQSHQFWASWTDNKTGKETLHSKQVTYPLDKSEPYTAACFAAWSNPEVILEEFIPPSEVAGFFGVWQELLAGAEKLKAEFFSEGVYYSEAYMRYGCFGINIRRQLSNEEKHILKRFSVEFERAYTRFLDLRKAEAQARESQVEAALEKVRSRSLAMQSPDELIEVAQLLREEMGALRIEELETSSIYIHNENTGNTQCWFTIKDAHSGKAVADQMTMDLRDTWVGREMLDFYRSDAKKTSILMQGEHRIEWIRYCGEKSNVFTPEGFYGDTIPERTYHLNKFTNGYIGAASQGDISNESWDLLKRATSVFSFAYTRFRDLQKAEIRAREARIELALERIRAQVASMQESSDLLDIVVTMRKEFVGLGHQAHYFWYMRWLPEKYEKAMTSGDGTRIGMVMSLPRHIHGDVKLVADWEKSDEPTVVFAMDKETAVDYVHKMITLGDFQQIDPQAPTLDDIRQLGGLTFIMARTTRGEIGFSLPGEVHHPPKDAVNTLARFALVFDLAYKRFEDLKTAEKDLIEIKAARQKAEEALIELKATQTQLIQQEKLASLGQLTAGIAHEIKNPLNFVNNFSEVSMELIEEVMEEVKTQRLASQQTITEILSDIHSNLIKIHEHGTRADSIVKSMLQHSRGGSGKMEPTDLNDLVKEYSSLCFHGMRAGNNPINVDIQWVLDNNIDKVPLIKEDFSRVIINLCNNAFDAMRESVRQSVDYKPVLTIISKKNDLKAVVEIHDNGPGIPDEIKDKILQPFFTTKKGTEGTGLGLSISHDIVKAHGGELIMESKSGEGTNFIISVPIKS
jgi:signal transduction histidine kinase